MGMDVTKEDRYGYMVCCCFADNEEHQAFLKWDGRLPLPSYGACLVRLRLPKGTRYISPGSGPGRCSRAFAEKVMDLEGMPLKRGIACSMYDTEFVIRAGDELLPPRELETETATERLTGIHFFDTMEDALRWAGKEQNYAR